MTLETLLYAALLVVVGAAICVVLGGWVVGRLIGRCLEDEPTDNGIRGAGRAIGWAERSLIFVFILADAPTAIGLLVAAKSIMRIGEITEQHDSDDDKENEDDEEDSDADEPPRPRIVAEYVIFGTLASFAWGVSVSYLVRWILITWIL
ncbi:MAG: hypothetical protein ACOCV2_15430 [Persicimonas sp.]